MGRKGKRSAPLWYTLTSGRWPLTPLIAHHFDVDAATVECSDSGSYLGELVSCRAFAQCPHLTHSRSHRGLLAKPGYKRSGLASGQRRRSTDSQAWAALLMPGKT
jgi:hypothetical protein